MKFGSGSLGKFARGKKHYNEKYPQYTWEIPESPRAIKLRRRRKKAEQKRRIKNFLHGEQKGLCSYCKEEMAREDSTLDHVIPKSQGGNNKLSNFVLACYDCNQRKADKLLAPSEKLQ